MQFSFNDLKLRGFAGHTAAVRTISVNEPIKRFASGSRDRTVKIWSLNIHEGIEHWETSPYSECLMTYTGHRRGTINDVHFLPGVASGLTDVMASCDGHVHVSLRHSIHFHFSITYTKYLVFSFGIQKLGRKSISSMQGDLL